MYGGNRFVVTGGKQIVVEYTVPSDQIPSGESVYVDIIDSSGNPVSDPIEMSRVGSEDVVKATLTTPTTVGKYEIVIWIGTWDGTSRSISEKVGYIGLEIVDEDLEDKVSGLKTEISDINTKLDDLSTKVDTIMKWLKRSAL